MNWYEDMKYWKMCEKAVELQEIAKKDPPKIGGYVNVKVGVDTKARFFIKNDTIWIPHMMELERLINTKGYPDWEGCYYKDTGKIRGGKIHKYGEIIFETKNDSYNTFEKVWLAFVMFTRYQKKWDFEKEEWIKD